MRDGTITEIEPTEEEVPLKANGNGINHEHTSTATNISETSIEDEILEKGAVFLEGLLNILSNPESTERLVSKITETDKETGQAYLKLPIANSGMVENALKLISGLFGGLGKR